MSARLRAHRIGPARPLVALVLACVSLVTPLAELAHVADAHHVRCADHGEEVHLASAPAAAIATTPPGEAPATDPASGGEPGESHGHCALVPGHLSRLGAQSPPAAALVPALMPPPSPQPPDGPAIARALSLRLAPKTSPPRPLS